MTMYDQMYFTLIVVFAAYFILVLGLVDSLNKSVRKYIYMVLGVLTLAVGVSTILEVLSFIWWR